MSDEPDHRSRPPGPGDSAGPRPDAPLAAYGEPHGPRPPRVRRLPKAEIERRAVGGITDPPAVEDGDGRERDGFFGGLADDTAASRPAADGKPDDRTP